MNIYIQHTLAGISFCLTLACAMTLSQAQTPLGIPTAMSPSVEPSQAKPSEEAAIAELEDKRAKAEAELKGVTANTVSTISQEELERRSLFEQVVRGYDEQLDNYQRLKEAGQRLADI